MSYGDTNTSIGVVASLVFRKYHSIPFINIMKIHVFLTYVPGAKLNINRFHVKFFDNITQQQYVELFQLRN